MAPDLVLKRMLGKFDSPVLCLLFGRCLTCFTECHEGVTRER